MDQLLVIREGGSLVLKLHRVLGRKGGTEERSQGSEPKLWREKNESGEVDFEKSISLL